MGRRERITEYAGRLRGLETPLSHCRGGVVEGVDAAEEEGDGGEEEGVGC